MVDIWRLQHPSDRDYSFYSHVHRSYARIDYFIADSRLISNINHTKYHNIIISNHSHVTLNLRLCSSRQAYSWRFNPYLLEDQDFKTHITMHISQILDTNDNGEVNDTTLWETLKVYIRGQIISYEATLKRTQRGRLLLFLFLRGKSMRGRVEPTMNYGSPWGVAAEQVKEKSILFIFKSS